jgi:hypothetical protein
MVSHSKVVEKVLNAFDLLSNKLVMRSIFRSQIFDVAIFRLVVIVPGVSIIKHDGSGASSCDVES